MSSKVNKIVTLQGNNKDEKYEVKLTHKFIISPDTIKFRFGLASPNHVLGLPIGQHILFVIDLNGSMVIRPYSPVSDDDDLGYVDVVIKVYRKGVHPNFPDGGKMSQHLESMKIGDTITMKGPVGYMVYKGLGEFHIKKDLSSPEFEIKKTYKRIGMLAGGTGITPMLQVSRSILKNPKDTTVVSLLFSNHTEDDVLCREDLDDLAKQYPTRFKVWYTVTNEAKPPSSKWSFSKGRVNADMIKQHLPSPSKETFIYLCGPPGFSKEGCHPALDILGYSKEDRFG